MKKILLTIIALAIICAAVYFAMDIKDIYYRCKINNLKDSLKIEQIDSTIIPLDTLVKTSDTVKIEIDSVKIK